jgi:rod shape-determining protein MreD
MEQRPAGRIWILLIAALALQTTLLGSLQIGGAHLDLLLLSVVSVALLVDWPLAAVYGLCAGLLTGAYVGTNMGSFALSMMAAGALIAQSDRLFSRENPLAPPLCVLGATAISHSVFLVISPIDFPIVWFLRHALTVAVTHAVLILPLHYLVERFVLPARRGFLSPSRL